MIVWRVEMAGGRPRFFTSDAVARFHMQRHRPHNWASETLGAVEVPDDPIEMVRMLNDEVAATAEAFQG